MKYYSQIDPEYKTQKLALSNLTIEGFGCYLCSIATLAQVHPLELMRAGMRERYGFTDDGLVYSATIARLAGMNYLGKFKNPAKKSPCIAVTKDYQSSGSATHFFVYLPNGKIIDPLDYPCEPKNNPYKIAEYRLFDEVKLLVGFVELAEELQQMKRLNSELWHDIEKFRLQTQKKLHQENLFINQLIK